MTMYTCQKCDFKSDKPGKHCKLPLRKMTEEEMAKLKQSKAAEEQAK